MGTAITQYEPGAYLTQWREPEEVLAEAQKAALALKRVVSMKKNPVVFNGEQYLEREDWGTVAKFYGCTAKTVETRYVEFGNERGWEAVAVVIDRNMNEIGRAESMCLSGESNWGDVPVYEWEDELDSTTGKKIWVEGKNGKKGYYKGKKVQKGTQSKPLFQLRSMAATRAEAKALKGVFSWVVVLAGYQPTPAEEMTGNENFEEREQEQRTPPVQQPSRASEKKQQPAAQQAAASPGEVSGIIESVKTDSSNNLWMVLKNGGLIKVMEANSDGDMKPGYFIKIRGESKKNAEGKEFHVAVGLMELSPVQDGTPAQEKADKAAPLAPDAQAVADEMFGKQEPQGNAAVQQMVDNGTLKPASALPEGGAKKPGTIGIKRAQRVWALINQNKANNHGFNETELKKIMTALPVPIEHLRDLEMGMYPTIEAWANGEQDWQEFWEKD